jgi:hypothetical protein
MGFVCWRAAFGVRRIDLAGTYIRTGKGTREKSVSIGQPGDFRGIEVVD